MTTAIMQGRSLVSSVLGRLDMVVVVAIVVQRCPYMQAERGLQKFLGSSKKRRTPSLYTKGCRPYLTSRQATLFYSH